MSEDRTTKPDAGVPSSVRGRISAGGRDLSASLYGVACWVLFCVVATLVWPALLVLPTLSSRWTLTRVAARLLCACLGIPFQASGAPLADQPCVYVANHMSFLDSFAVGLMFAEPVVFVAGGVLSNQRVVGSFLRQIGVVFVRNEGGEVRSSVESVLTTLQDVVLSGRSIVLFPEGGLTLTPEVRRFHLGAFVVAAKTGCPVVPVGIIGTRAILPAGRHLPRRGAIHLVVGKPLLPAGSDWKAAHQLADEAHEAVERLLGES
jgi:1-acyl-sn-glycerol-3-phosphate acyltransferase